MENLIPTKCPYCGQDLEFDGVHLKCTNIDCEGKKEEKFKDAVAVLGIKGFGPEMASNFFHAGIKSVFDLFIPCCMLPASKKIWDKNVEKVCKTIQGITSIPLEKIIMLCMFEGVGETTAKQLALWTAKKWSVINEDKYNFSGINKEVIAEYQENGINEVGKILSNFTENIEGGGPEIIFPEVVSGGKGVEFTGSPKPYFETKEKFLEEISKYGFKHTKLTEATYLVTDSYESTSSKMVTARKKGIIIKTYKDFSELFLK